MNKGHKKALQKGALQNTKSNAFFWGGTVDFRIRDLDAKKSPSALSIAEGRFPPLNLNLLTTKTTV